MQRIIGIITGYSHSVPTWTAIRTEENLTGEVVGLDSAGFLRPRGDTYTTTNYAQELFKYGTWLRWAKQFDDSTKTPPDATRAAPAPLFACKIALIRLGIPLHDGQKQDAESSAPRLRRG